MDPKGIDVIIIGGGIIGSSVAFHLCLQNKSVLLIDAHHKGRATDAGAGIIAGATTFSEEEAMYKLVRDASKYYPVFIHEIRKYSDVPTGFTEVEELIISIDNTIEFDIAVDRILSRQQQSSYPPQGSLEQLNSYQVAEKYPTITTVDKALRYSAAAQVDGRQLTQAIIETSKQLGLTLINEKVTELLVEGNRCQGVRVGNKDYQANQVIIAGGAWSTLFEKQLNFEIGMFPQRGQIIHFEINEVDVGRLPVIIANHFYLLQWLPDTVVVGATRESDSGLDTNTTVDGVMDVLQAALSMVPALGKAAIKEIRVGLRPYSPDKLPIIGKVPDFENIWLVTGYGPLGLTAAPYTGKLVGLYLEQPEDEALKAYSPDRFC